MRNLIENHVEDFSEILKYDKSNWDDFWKSLKKRFFPILDNIEEKVGKISFEKEERRSLDKLVQEFREILNMKKEKITEKIRRNSNELQLSKEDFIIFIAFIPNDFDWIVVQGNRENILFLNTYSLWKKGFLEKLEDLVYQSVIHYRHGEEKGIFYDKESLFKKLFDQILLLDKSDTRRFMKDVCQLLYSDVPYFDWVGFYMLNNKNLLELWEFVGEPTEHIEIPIGKGICGQAAEKKSIFIVQDVSKETNYLSCSPNVKSEIVVPIFKNGQIIGELDIDSHFVAPFDDRDKDFLEKVCKEITKIYE
jgi:GAF domain-containing protein